MGKTKNYIVAAALALLALSASADQGNLEKAVRILEQQSRAGKGEFVTFLTGAATAYRWVSVSERRHTDMLYCPPPNIRLDGKAYAKIALDEYRREKSEYSGVTDYPLNVLTLALLRGLQDKYPCLADREKTKTSEESF
jgi:hypothetical protein